MLCLIVAFYYENGPAMFQTFKFLTKPVNTAELLARIKSMLRLRQYQEQLSIRTESEVHFGGPSQQEDFSDEDVHSQRVLLVENDEKDIKLAKNFLDGENYELIVVKTGEEAFSIALNEKIDLIRPENEKLLLQDLT